MTKTTATVTTRPARIAIIGAGLMGRELAAAMKRWPALIDHPVTPELVAVCDINPAAFTSFAGITSVRHFVTDYRELLGNKDIDIFYVAVRHDLHEQIYRDVIAAGHGLLAEKPFGIDAAASKAIMATLAEHPESFVRCSSEMPFFPGAQAAINYVRSGAVGRIISARSSFLHASDLNPAKPLNWKRQVEFCGRAGVMNDLGMHAWHVPLRLGWQPDRITAELEDIVTTRPGPDGAPLPCDTWDNATVHSWVAADDYEFPLTVETKRIAPGEKNTWALEVIGMTGGVRFSTKNPKELQVFSVADIPGVGSEQLWSSIDTGSQSVWPTVTGGIFEFGFSDAILQMMAVYLAEWAGELSDGFAAATPEEAALTHRIYAAAIAAHETGIRQTLA